MSEGFTPPNEEEAEANIEEFIDQHGLEGFLVLYNRQMIYRFIKQEFLSSSAEVDDVGEQMYLGEDGDDTLHDKREELKRHSERWARCLVDQLKEDDEVGEVIANDEFERLNDEDVEERWEAIFHNTLDEWRGKAELYVEQEQTKLPSAEPDEP